MFDSVLIANRGEIAVRIIRTCRELGIRAIAVYSEADRAALHVRMADAAVEIGPAPVTESYLVGERLVQAALDSGAQAIHPGYGLLSENADFARQVREAGLVFIGPEAAAIEAMGDKAAARRLMKQAGVPIIPGAEGQMLDETSFSRAADEIGYPVLIKAAGGGGGKGMRVVERPKDLLEMAAAARREARHAFGDDRLLIEKFIPEAHHIEFQIFGDPCGKLLHLFERECSVQRRHQKIIEESPSPLLDAVLRQQMGEAAVQAARAVNYTNAGTVEFIFNPLTQEYYFLEMNTRLQVEHPVTELVSGLDLVKWQLRVAAGECLPFEQADIYPHGHAIECRLYAEDPEHLFLPASGTVLRFREPAGPGIRVDSGITSGDPITVHYDPLIAKIVAYAENRAEAIRRVRYALNETVLLGLTSNLAFLQDVLNHPDFEAGQVHTTWVEEHFSAWSQPVCGLQPEVLIAAALSEQLARPSGIASQQSSDPDPFSPWTEQTGFRTGQRRKADEEA